MYQVANGAVSVTGSRDSVTSVGITALETSARSAVQSGIRTDVAESQRMAAHTTTRYRPIAATMSRGAVGCSIHHTPRATKYIANPTASEVATLRTVLFTSAPTRA